MMCQSMTGCSQVGDLHFASSLSEEKIARRALSTDQFPNVHYCVHAEATGALHRVRQDLTVA